MGKAFEAPRSDLYSFDPEILCIQTDEEHPLYDPRIRLPLDDALVRNIMFYGVIEPVVITKETGNPVVVAGRRRVLHAREANKRLHEQGKDPIRVKCEIRRGDRKDLFGVSLAENEGRIDETPMGRARKLQRFLNFGGTEEEAAITFGVTEQSIRNWLLLAELSAPVKKAVDEGKIAASAAVQFCGLSANEQKAALEELTRDDGKPTAKKARQIAHPKKSEEEQQEAAKRTLKRLLKSFDADFLRSLIETLCEEEEETNEEAENAA